MSFPMPVARHHALAPRLVLAVAAGACGFALLVALVARRTGSPAPDPSAAVSARQSAAAPRAKIAAAPAAPPASSASESVAPAGSLAAVMIEAEAGRHARAAALLAALPDGERAAAIASVYDRWAEAAPEAASASALALADHVTRASAWRAVVRRRAFADPAGLAAHAGGSPPGPERHAALEAALARWLELDAPAAVEWIGRLPASPENDVVVAQVARHAAQIDRRHESALEWAEAIQEPALRSRVLGDVIRDWRDHAPRAAEAYARVTPHLTASEREDILVGERFTPHP